MRVAVCISGQARFAERGWEYIKEQIVYPFSADVFCHFWDTTDPRTEMDPQKAIDLYKPVDYLIQDQEFFQDEVLDTSGIRNERTEWFFRRMSSMFYSIKVADSLRRANENATQSSYDMVIKARSDIKLAAPMSSLETDYRFLWCYKVIKIDDVCTYSYGDELAWGSSEIMSRWSETYDHIDEAIQKYKVVRPDVCLSYNLEECNSEIKIKESSVVGRPEILRNASEHQRRLDALHNGEVPVNDE